MKILELFSPDKAAKLSWPDGRQARATLPGNKRLVINFISHGDGVFAIEFNVDDEFELTGRGDVSSVFTTVIAAVNQFVQHKGPDLKALFFTADEESRAKMYDTLAKRVAKQAGWHVVPYEEMVADEKYKTPLSYGDFLFAMEPGNAPEHRQAAQKPQHGEFLTIFYVVAVENPELPAIKIKAKNSYDAEKWVMRNFPEFKNEHPFSVIPRRVPPDDRKIIDKGTVPEKPKPEPIDPNSLGAKLRAKLSSPN